MKRLSRWIREDAGLRDDAPLRFLLGTQRQPPWQAMVAKVLLAVAYIVILFLVSVWVAPATVTASARFSTALYVPTVFAQTLVSAGVFALTLHTIHAQRRKQTWDTLRATAGGATAALRAAWAATVYYRLRSIIGILIYVPRIVLLALLLWDLTAFRGDYLIQIAGGHQPVIPPLLELPLMGAFIAAAFVLPISGLGLEAAVGLLFATLIRSRQTAALVQIALTIGRGLWALVPVIWLGDVLAQASTGSIADPVAGWFAMLLGAAAGDWGLSALHASAIDHLWAAVPYAAYIGIALLGIALLQSGLTVIILRWAARCGQNLD
jgi:hypothetical protein